MAGLKLTLHTTAATTANREIPDNHFPITSQSPPREARSGLLAARGFIPRRSNRSLLFTSRALLVAPLAFDAGATRVRRFVAALGSLVLRHQALAQSAHAIEKRLSLLNGGAIFEGNAARFA